MHNHRWQKSPQARIRKLSVSLGILVAVDHVCLNFLQCLSFQVPPFPWAGSKAAWKADCGYNLWCEHGCAPLSLNRSRDEVLIAHTLEHNCYFKQPNPFMDQTPVEEIQEHSHKATGAHYYRNSLFSQSNAFHHFLYIPFYLPSGNMHSLKMCLITCWEQMHKTYMQELTEIRFCTYTSSCRRT